MRPRRVQWAWPSRPDTASAFLSESGSPDGQDDDVGWRTGKHGHYGPPGEDIDQVVADIDRADYVDRLAVTMPFGQVGQQIINRSEITGIEDRPRSPGRR